MKKNVSVLLVMFFMFFFNFNLTLCCQELSITEVKNMCDMLRMFGGQWVTYKAREFLTAYNVYEKYEKYSATSWFNTVEKWKRFKEVDEASKLFKIAHEETKDYERKIKWRQVRDTGKEIFDYVMEGLGLIGSFVPGVAKFHAMITASEEFITAAYEFEKEPWWKFWKKIDLAAKLRLAARKVRMAWEEFKNTGGGQLVKKIIDVAGQLFRKGRETGRIEETSGWNIDIPGQLEEIFKAGRDIVEIFTGKTERMTGGRIDSRESNGRSPDNNTSTLTTGGSQLTDELKELYELRQAAYKRYIEALQIEGFDPQALEILNEDFTELDQRYRILLEESQSHQ